MVFGDRLAGLGVLPPGPQADDAPHTAVRGADPCLPAWLPIRNSARRDDAPTALERVAEYLFVGIARRRS